MEDSVSCKISFPYWVAYKATLQVIIRSPSQMAFSMIFPLAGIYLIYMWVTYHYSIKYYDILLLGLCFFFTPLIISFTLYLSRRRNPFSVGPFEYTFNSNGIHAIGEAFESTILWTAVRKMVESRDFILYFITPSRAVTMPKSQLKDAGVLEDVRKISLNNMQQSK